MPKWSCEKPWNVKATWAPAFDRDSASFSASNRTMLSGYHSGAHMFTPIPFTGERNHSLFCCCAGQSQTTADTSSTETRLIRAPDSEDQPQRELDLPAVNARAGQLPVRGAGEICHREPEDRVVGEIE